MKLNHTIGYCILRRALKAKKFPNFDKILTDLDISHVNVVICSAKFNFSSIIMTKYFTDLWPETGILLKIILMIGIDW